MSVQKNGGVIFTHHALECIQIVSFVVIILEEGLATKSSLSSVNEAGRKLAAELTHK